MSTHDMATCKWRRDSHRRGGMVWLAVPLTVIVVAAVVEPAKATIARTPWPIILGSILQPNFRDMHITPTLYIMTWWS
jgi:hypothetical protein